MKALSALLALFLSIPLAADQDPLLLPSTDVQDVLPLVDLANAIELDDGGFMVRGLRFYDATGQRSLPEGVHYAIYLDRDGGAQRIVALPFERSAQLSTFLVDGVVFVFDRESFVRLTQDGVALDAAPHRLPVDVLGPVTAMAASDEHVLVAHGSAGYFVEPDASLVPVELPGTTYVFASNGTEFLLRYGTFTPRLALLDRDGSLLRSIDDPRPETGAVYIASDRDTWGVFKARGTPHLYLFDRNLDLLGTRWDSAGDIAPPAAAHGRGYYSSIIESRKAFEMRPPEYRPEETADLPAGYRRAWGRTSDFVSRTVTEESWPTVWIGPNFETAVADPSLLRPIDAAFPVEREQASIATNDAGVSLLVWWESSFGATRADVSVALRAARISAQGFVFDAEPLTLVTADKALATTVVGSNGDGFLVAWGEQKASVSFRAVSAAGELSPVIPVANADFWSALAVVRDGTDYGVFWRPRDGMVRALKAAANGAVVLPVREIGRAEQMIAAPHDDGFMLAILPPPNFSGRPWYVQMMRLRHDLTVASGPSSVQQTKGFDPQLETLTRAGDRYLLTYSTTAGLSALSLRASGTPITTNFIETPLVSGNASRSKAACDTTGCTLLWAEPGVVREARLTDAATFAAEPATLVTSWHPWTAPLLLRGKLFVYAAFTLEDGLQVLVRRPPPAKVRSVR